MRQLYTYVVNESTLIEENTKRTLIKFSENNVRAWKLNEPADFLVSFLNNSGSRQQVTTHKNTLEKIWRNMVLFISLTQICILNIF